MRALRLAFLSIYSSCSINAQSTYAIQTIAGRDFPERAPAGSVSIGNVTGIAADINGNVFLASHDMFRVFRITPDGLIQTHIQEPDSPDFADQFYLSGIAVDSLGNVYFTSYDNGYLKKVDPPGNLTNVAAAGLPTGVAVDLSNTVYVTDASSASVRKIAPSGETNLFRLRSEPNGIAVDAAGTVYVSESVAHQVVRVDPSGQAAPFAGTGEDGGSGDGGLAAKAQLHSPAGLALDPAGNLYIEDLGHIRRVDSSGTIRSVVFDRFRCYADPDSSCVNPSSPVAADRTGNLYVTFGYQVWRSDPTGHMDLLAGNNFDSYSGDGGPAVSAQLNLPIGLQADNEGNLLIADSLNGAVRRIDPLGTITSLVTPVLAPDTGLPSPFIVAAAALDSNGRLLISDTGSNQIYRVEYDGSLMPIAGTGAGGYSGDNGPAIAARLNKPRSLIVDGAGAVFFTDTGNNCVRRIDSGGMITTVAGTSTPGFQGDGGPATNARLRSPQQLALDSGGNLYVADTGNSVIRRIDTQGVISTVAGTGLTGFSGDGGAATKAQLWGPVGVAIDGDGNLFISDRGNARIRAVDGSGVITTIAGGGPQSQDSAAADQTSLGSPQYLLLDSSGRIYFPDGNSIRVLTPKPRNDL
jgi:sugar lactone lactonase YvrE